MGAGMIPKSGGGGGGALGWDPFGNQAANPRPNLRNFSDPGRYPDAMLREQLGAGATTPRTQTAQQYQDFQQANKDWSAIDAARKKRQEAYEAMAQKTGPTPKGVGVGQYKKAGDPLAMGVAAPAYEPALYGQPRKWRDQYASIVNLRST